MFRHPKKQAAITRVNPIKNRDLEITPVQNIQMSVSINGSEHTTTPMRRRVIFFLGEFSIMTES